MNSPGADQTAMDRHTRASGHSCGALPQLPGPWNPGPAQSTTLTGSVISRYAARQCKRGAPSQAAPPRCHLFVNTWLNPKLLLISGRSPLAPQQDWLQQGLQDKPPTD